MEYTIRRVTSEGIPTFIDLRARMFREVGFDELGDLSEVSEEYFERAIPLEEFVGFVAVTADDTTVGSAGLSYYHMPPKAMQADGRFGYVSSMYVLHDHRRRGLAKRMTEAIMDYAEQAGLTWLTLHASKMGRPIYEAIGFKSWNEMCLHVPTGQANRRAH